VHTISDNAIGSSKFKDLESLANPQRHLLNQEYNAVTKKIKQVKVKENNFVLYTEQDSIFSLSEEIGRDEWDLEATDCNNCIKNNQKLKNCQFCGTMNCPTCLYKTRPYPMNNPTKERRGLICLACNKKFLYRDAMHEYAIKLELREGVTQTQSEELEFHEEKYNKLMSDLTELKETKMEYSNDLAKKKSDVAG
jgi:hypothetical protein